MKKTGQVLRIVKLERFGKLDKFEKILIDLERFELIWKDLKKLIRLEIESIGSRSRTEFTFSLVFLSDTAHLFRSRKKRINICVSGLSFISKPK